MVTVHLEALDVTDGPEPDGHETVVRSGRTVEAGSQRLDLSLLVDRRT